MSSICQTVIRTVVASILALPCAAASADVPSTFDSDDEGWRVQTFTDFPTFNLTFLQTYVPTYRLSGGNPDGHILGSDVDSGDFAFKAPAKFLGNFSSATTLTYDFIHPSGAANLQTFDVFLGGDGRRLFWFSSPPLTPGVNWSSVSVPLVPSAQWRVNSPSGPTPTPSQFQSTLANLTELYIRGEYTVGNEQHGLDNVRFVTVPTVFGDYNNNGVVDGADYIVWRKNKGLTGAPTASQGNGNGDNVVDELDYDYWRARFGNTMGSGLSGTGLIPEPATYSLVAMALIVGSTLIRMRQLFLSLSPRHIPAAQIVNLDR